MLTASLLPGQPAGAQWCCWNTCAGVLCLATTVLCVSFVACVVRKTAGDILNHGRIILMMCVVSYQALKDHLLGQNYGEFDGNVTSGVCEDWTHEPR